MSRIAKSTIFFILFIFFGLSPLSAELIRAAFDVGSGQTKMTVAVVDKQSGRPLQILFAEETPVLVAHSFKQSKDGRIGEPVLAELENVLIHYRDIARSHGAQELSGVATAVFRESINGAEFIGQIKDKLELNLRIITQEEEGRIGFLTAVAASGKNDKNIVAWDSGGASFQFSTRNGEQLEVYKGPWGASKVLAAIVDIQGHDFTKIQTANPAKIDAIVALQQIIKKNLPSLSKTMQMKLSSPLVDVVAIGGPFSAFQIAATAVGANVYTKEQIWKAIEELVGNTDAKLALRFPEAEMVIPRLTLLYTVMKAFNISKVHYFPTVGSTLGILMTPALWEEMAVK